MRREASVVSAAQAYQRHHQRLTFSIVTRYEILRGLKAKNATAQLANFRNLCEVSEILPITDRIIEVASDIYADLHRGGLLLPDADILIAATALSNDYPIVTNNTAHFSRVNGLTILNWAH